MERQRAETQAKAGALGIDDLVIVEDTAVSGFRVHPLRRPKLSKALEELETFDYLLYWRQDRFVRRVIPDFWDMVMLCQKHNVKMVSATEELGDPTVHAEMLPPFIKAWLAQGESESTSERMIGTKAHFRNTGRWVGGHPPYGYMPVRRPEGGWALVIDETSAAVVREAVRRVIAGEAVNAIVADLNRRHVLTPYNHERLRAWKALTAEEKAGRESAGGGPLQTNAGDDTSGAVWRQRTLMRVLRNPAMLGYTTHGTETVSRDDGSTTSRPAVAIGDDGTLSIGAPALINHAEWDELQHALDQQSVIKHRTQTPNLLLGVAVCALCSAPMYRGARSSGDKTWAYYRCRHNVIASEAGKPCDTRAVRADWLESVAGDIFLEAVGDLEVIRMVYEAGTDNTEERRRLRDSLRMVRAEHDRGQYEYPGGDEDYRERTERMVARLRKLPETITPAGYKPQPTGRTFRQEWAARDVQGRRQLMAGAGFRLRVAKFAGTGGMMVAMKMDDELSRRAGLVASGQPVQVPPDTWGTGHGEISRELAERATRTLTSRQGTSARSSSAPLPGSTKQ